MEKTKFEKNIDFWTQVLNILDEDCTQTCNDAKGTKIRIEHDGITIMDGISKQTLSRLLESGYLTDLDEIGRVRINKIRIKGDDSQ